MSAGRDVWGDREAAGPPHPFFGSRWVQLPAHVRELSPEAGLPAGFRAAGVACGIKPSGNPDLGLLVCDLPEPVSAARFADTGAPAAPVMVSRERCELSSLRAILANSGCANAATGRRGIDDAAKTQGAAAMALGIDPSAVLLGSTGGISDLLPVENVLRGILAAHKLLAPDGDASFQQAIQTTDAFEKRANLAVSLPSGEVRLSAQCKGAGMISPRFATMFCFVQTDAELLPETAELLLSVCLKRSFDRCTVDGQLSTNDTAALICSGASGVRVRPESEDELRFGEALDALLRQLAILMVADGEGARRIARVVVRGGEQDRVELAARAVANSPLVKAALYGGDPNWGRIVQAIGGALGGGNFGAAPLGGGAVGRGAVGGEAVVGEAVGGEAVGGEAVGGEAVGGEALGGEALGSWTGGGHIPLDVSIEGVQVCSAGAAVLDTDEVEARLRPALERKEVEYEIVLPGDGAETEVFFSDLSYEYVRINAEYTT